MITFAVCCAIGAAFLLGLILGMKFGEDQAIEAMDLMVRDGRLFVDAKAMVLAKKMRGHG